MKSRTRIRIFRGEHYFASAHFLVGMGKCERLHGHNYSVCVEICGEPGEDGTVLDFNTINPVISSICQSLDHRTLIAEGEKRCQLTIGAEEVEVRFEEKRYIFPRQDCVILPIGSTTVERLAAYLADKLADKLPHTPDLEWIEVGVREGAAQMAIYRLEL